MVLNHSCIRWIGICHCPVTIGENLFSKVYCACVMRSVFGILYHCRLVILYLCEPQPFHWLC